MMIKEIRTASIFKDAEWIADMNSGQIIDRMKDLTFSNRTKGRRKTSTKIEIVQRTNSNNELYDYELRTPICQVIEGTDMSKYRAIIDGTEYTWGEMKKFPKELLQIKLYRYWLVEQKYNGEEE